MSDEQPTLMSPDNPGLIRLQAGGAECVLISGADAPACLLHLGANLGAEIPPAGFAGAWPGNLIDAPVLAPLLPDPACGWTGAPGWQGPDPTRPWRVDLEQLDAGLLAARCSHPSGYQLEVNMEAVADGLFAFSLTGRHPPGVAPGRVHVGVPLPANAVEACVFGGRWAGEMAIERIPLTGGFRRGSHAGSRTAHDAFPAIVAGSMGFSAESGEVLGLHLGWWGNYELVVERTRDSGFRASFSLDPLELEPLGEGRFRTPKLFVGWSNRGLNGLRVVFQEGVRTMRRASGAVAPGKVQLNTWEGVYFDHSEDRLRQMAGTAAAMGFERFVLDDGWFGRRGDDTKGLGDWTPRPEVYPDGLGGLIEHVRAQGLEFGLWFEPEMVSADSALFEAHPDWILGDVGQPLGRNQYGLDLCNPECFEHLRETMTRVLADARIAAVKWDMNRDLPQAAGRPLAPAAGRLIQSVRDSRPGLEIEACASGGGRADLGTLMWCSRVWLSDAHDPDIRTPMMAAYSLFAPPEVMGCHIGPATSHQTGRRWSLHVRASMSVLGSMGMELDPLTLSEEEARIVAEYVALHRQHRPWLREGHLLELEHPDPGLSALGVFSAARDRALVFLLQRRVRAQTVPSPLRIPHVKGTVSVSAPLVDPSVRVGASGQPAWLNDQSISYSGEFLAGHGLPVPILAPMRGVLVELVGSESSAGVSTPALDSDPIVPGT